MLLSQALFIDHEYKADCLNKINYLEYIKTKEDENLIREDILTVKESSVNAGYLNKTKIICDGVQKIIKEY